MTLWGEVGMFLSLLQFFATKFLVLALHLESGSEFCTAGRDRVFSG